MVDLVKPVGNSNVAQRQSSTRFGHAPIHGLGSRRKEYGSSLSRQGLPPPSKLRMDSASLMQALDDVKSELTRLHRRMDRLVKERYR
jgi:hypothetical protein